MILEMATEQHRVLNIRRTLDFILWKMGSCWSVARGKNCKAVWLSLLFLKMLQFSISFRIKFKWFILAHNVFIVSPQPIYLASSASFPHGPFTLAKLDYVQFPGQVMMIHVLVSVFLHTVYPVRKPSPQPTGSLALFQRVLFVLSPFPSLATLYSSHGVLEHIAFF